MIQLAKAQGLKVIGSAGTEDKVAFVKSVGADVAFNYKTTKTAEVLAKEGPINVSVVVRHLMRYNRDLTGVCIYSYWDNVGGESLEAALEFSSQHANFIVRLSLTRAPFTCSFHFCITKHHKCGTTCEYSVGDFYCNFKLYSL